MAHYNSLEDAFKDLDRQFAEFQKGVYKVEGDLFYKYDRDIREVTPIDTGRTRRYPHTQTAMLAEHTLEWSPKQNTSINKNAPFTGTPYRTASSRSYVGYIYNNRKIKFRNPNAINRWDIRTARKNNKKYAQEFNSMVLRYFT